MQRLSREMCLNLKEKGFEQSIECGEWYYDTDLKSQDARLSSFEKPWSERCTVLCPSVERLIEAVWAKVSELQMVSDPNGCWTVTGINKVKELWYGTESTSLPAALAELWLKLKEAQNGQ